MGHMYIFKVINLIKVSRPLCARYYLFFSNIRQYSVYSRYELSKSLYLSTAVKPAYISNYCSMHMKLSNSVDNKDDDEKNQKVLEDQEFQNILKDFVNDFGVDSETNKLLDDIRKNINDDYRENKLAAEKLPRNDNDAISTLGGGLDHKYKEFSDVDSAIIHSYEDHPSVFEDEQFYHIDQELQPKFSYDNVKRGITGVFDIGDIIQVLRNESLLDIATISMLTDNQVCSSDFLVLVTAKSLRHSEAITESLNKLYKMKKNKSDPFVKIEGEAKSGWKVMDMGNIVLHIFLEETRAKYDIESCQLLDLEFDSGGNVQIDPMLNIIEEQLEFFNSLQQSKSNEEVSKDIS